MLPALLGFAAGPLAFPADLVAQAESGRPSGTLAAWIQQVRASPFHDLAVSGTPANPAAALAAYKGVRLPHMVRPPPTPSRQSPDGAVSFEKVFAYTSLAALVPLVPALIRSTADPRSWFVTGAAVTLLSVPVAAISAGTTSVPHAILGTASGSVAGTVLAAAFRRGFGDYWLVPTYSVTMALVTAGIAAR